MLYKSLILFIPYKLVNNRACQYFSLSHNKSSILNWLLLNTCSVVVIFSSSMFIVRAAAFIIKMACSTTMIFVDLNVRFVDSKSLLKINGWPYILFSTVGTCYQIDNIATITWQITFNEISLTCYCTSKLTICNQKVLTNVTFVTANNSTITFNARLGV